MTTDDTSKLDVLRPPGTCIAPSALAAISADPASIQLDVSDLKSHPETFAHAQVVKVTWSNASRDSENTDM